MADDIDKLWAAAKPVQQDDDLDALWEKANPVPTVTAKQQPNAEGMNELETPEPIVNTQKEGLDRTQDAMIAGAAKGLPFADEAVGGVMAAGQTVRDYLQKKGLLEGEPSGTSFGEKYRAERDEFRAGNKQRAAQDRPRAVAAEIGTGIAANMALPGAAAKPGWQALLGGVSALDKSEQDLTTNPSVKKYLELIGEVGTGTALGGGLAKAGEGLTVGSQRPGQLSDFAERRAVKSIEPLKRDYQLLQEGDSLNKVGRALLNPSPVDGERVLRAGSGIDSTAKRIFDAEDAFGKNVSDKIRQVDVAHEPHVQKFEVLPEQYKRLSPEDQLKFRELMKERGAKFPIAREDVYRADGASDKVRHELIPALDNPAQKHTPAMSYVRQQEKDLKNYSLPTLEEGNQFKGKYAEAARWEAVNAPGTAAQARKLYGVVNSDHERQVLNAAQKVGDPKLSSDFLAAKAEYGPMAKAGEIAAKSVPGRDARRFISPSDYVGGAAAGSTLSPESAGVAKNALQLAGALGHKMVRERGNSVLAVGADNLAKYLPDALISNQAFMSKWGGYLGRNATPWLTDALLTKFDPEYAQDKQAALLQEPEAQ